MVTALAVVLKIVRQPVVVPGEAPAEVVQADAPIKSRLLLPIRILVCKPSVIVTGAEAVMVLVLTVWTVPVPLLGDVPATNKLEPLSSPTVAADIGGPPPDPTLGLMTRTAPLQ